MNPEFRRNLWIELTGPRIALAVGVPAILLLAVWLRPGHDITLINNISILLYNLGAFIGGPRRAANSIAIEVRGRTWEGQVMSALSAWSMTWGKLLGGCALVWISALICLGSSLAIELQIFPTGTALGNAGLRIFTAFAAQAVAFCSALIILRKSAAGKSLNSTLSQAVGLIAAAIFGLAFAPTVTQYSWMWTVFEQQSGFDLSIAWYGLQADGNLFRVVSLAIFVGWTWLAANRLMRHVLQYSSMPWAWPAFVIFMVVYFGGFFSAGAGSSGWVAAGFFIVAWLTYPAALSDVKDAVAYGWLRRDLSAGRWRNALQRMPAWMPTLAILLVFGIAVAVSAPFSSLSALRVDDFEGLGDLLTSGAWLSSSLMLAILLFVIRDLGIIHLLAFSDAGRYSDVVAVIVLIALYLVIPIAGSAAGSAAMVAAFLPLDLGDPAVTLGPVAVEAVATTIAARAMARRAARPPRPATGSAGASAAA
ncbi:MAG: hypothetical protein R3F55_25540 [Alphaproteobacteria bacterium]